MTPAHQLQRAVDSLPAAARIAPVSGAADQLNQGFHFGRQTELEQVVELPLFTGCDHRVVAEGAIAAQESRPAGFRQGIDQLPKTGLRMPGSLTVAGLNLAVHDQSQVGNEIGVRDMGGAPGLFGIEADLGSFLFSIERLDGGVNIQDVGFA